MKNSTEWFIVTQTEKYERWKHKYTFAHVTYTVISQGTNKPADDVFRSAILSAEQIKLDVDVY